MEVLTISPPQSFLTLQPNSPPISSPRLRFEFFRPSEAKPDVTYKDPDSASLTTLPNEVIFEIAGYLHTIHSIQGPRPNEEDGNGDSSDVRDLITLAKCSRKLYYVCLPRLYHTVELDFLSTQSLVSFAQHAAPRYGHLVRNTFIDFVDSFASDAATDFFYRCAALQHSLGNMPNLFGLAIYLRVDMTCQSLSIPAFQNFVESLQADRFQLSELNLFGPGVYDSTLAPFQSNNQPNLHQAARALLLLHGPTLRKLNVGRWNSSGIEPAGGSSAEDIISNLSLDQLQLTGRFDIVTVLPPGLRSLEIRLAYDIDFFDFVIPNLWAVVDTLESFVWDRVDCPDRHDTPGIVQGIAFSKLKRLSFHDDSHRIIFNNSFFSCFAVAPIETLHYSVNSTRYSIRSLQALIWALEQETFMPKLRKICLGRSREWNVLPVDEVATIYRLCQPRKIDVVLNGCLQ